MTREAFEQMIRRMSGEVPAEYFDGVTEVVVSPRAVPHPTRDAVFTLGECIPLPVNDEGPEGVQSRVVLYHGSFLALSELDDEFDWEQEGWETLTHELRHHVEWRARRDELEVSDWAAEQNYARQDGEPFDPLFFLEGEEPVPDSYHVGGDWFLDRIVDTIPETIPLHWQGRSYRVTLPAQSSLPVYLLVDGVVAPPSGDLIVVVRRRPRLWDLFRPRPLTHAVAHAVLDELPEVG